MTPNEIEISRIGKDCYRVMANATARRKVLILEGMLFAATVAFFVFSLVRMAKYFPASNSDIFVDSGICLLAIIVAVLLAREFLRDYRHTACLIGRNSIVAVVRRKPPQIFLWRELMSVNFTTQDLLFENKSTMRLYPKKMPFDTFLEILSKSPIQDKLLNEIPKLRNILEEHKKSSELQFYAFSMISIAMLVLSIVLLNKYVLIAAISLAVLFLVFQIIGYFKLRKRLHFDM